MKRLNFIDYYRVLEVHYDARPEVIQASYKRLSRLYHPDNGTVSDASMMNRINEAYAVLSDTAKRSSYHSEWLRYFTTRNQFVNSVVFTPPGQGDSSLTAAKLVMDAFFYAQKLGKHDEAYLLLTQEDKERTTLEDFSTWRELVSRCYEMQDYKVRYFSSYQNCRIDDVTYPFVAEFAVTVTDMDTLSLNVSSETVRKYAAFDGISWKICLGISSITKSILRFQLLAEKRSNFDPMMLYHSAVSLKDPLTGLLSESGFLEQADREVQRSRRYHNPFCIAAFRLLPADNAASQKQHSSNAPFRSAKDNPSAAKAAGGQGTAPSFHSTKDKLSVNPHEYRDICSFAALLSHYLRSTDLSARLNNGMIVCLFIETREHGAKKAAKKFLRLFEEKQKAQGLSKEQYCRLSYGIVPFKEHENIEDEIYAACSQANIMDNSIYFTDP
jgi:curved DNA-binding protein CbpA